MTTEFCLAVGQAPAALGSTQERLDWLEAATGEAVGKNAHLLIVPELFATGYNAGDRIVSKSEPVDGQFAKAVAGLAEHTGVAIHYGFSEQSGGKLYNSAQCFGPEGQNLGLHRKLVLPPGFEAEYFTPGRGLSLFDYAGLRFATLICYDAEFAETARHAAMLGAQVLLVPTALGAEWSWVARQMIPTRAFENGVFLAYANWCGEEGKIAYLGESFIAAPDGEILALADKTSSVITARLDIERVARPQARLPYLLDRQKLELQE